MCEFCVQHGDGKKWYLAMENYSQDLLDQAGRRDYAAHFLHDFPRSARQSLKLLEKLERTPFAPLAKPFLKARQQRDHFGQIVPLEEVEQVLRQVDGIARLPCVCRRATTGQQDARYCFALTADPQLAGMLDDSFSLEYLSAEEAIQAVRKMDQEGLTHSVWTFKTPFIGGLCNCDQDCMAYRVTHAGRHFPVMFRAEHVAAVDPAACNGCRACMRQCQYGAIRYSAVQHKVEIDARQCYGCGVCRAGCHKDAITLHARSADPVAAQIW